MPFCDLITPGHSASATPKRDGKMQQSHEVGKQRVYFSAAFCSQRVIEHKQRRKKLRYRPLAFPIPKIRLEPKIFLSCLLLRQCCRFGQQLRSNFRLCRKDAISTQNSFDIVAVLATKSNVASTMLLVWTGV